MSDRPGDRWAVTTTDRRTAVRLCLICTAFVVYGCTIPFSFDGRPAALAERLRAVSFNPLVSPDTGERPSLPDFAQNLLLFVPFGACGLAAADPRRRRTSRLVAVTLLGAALSTLMEAVQLLTSDRVTSATDVVANTMGTLAGALALDYGQWRFGARFDRRAAGGTTGLASPRLLAAAALLLASAWQPFDPTLEVGVLAGKVRGLLHDPWQAGPLRDEGLSVLTAGLFAVALLSDLHARGREYLAPRALAASAVALVVLEAGQLVLETRMPGLWDIAVSLLGLAAGSLLHAAARAMPRRPVLMTALVVTTAAAATLEMLSPFAMAPVRTPLSWMPFLGYYTATPFDASSHAFELALLFGPLGFCATVRSEAGSRHQWMAVTTAAAFALPLEWAQGWVVGRHPDITDVGVSMACTWLGTLLGHTASGSPSAATANETTAGAGHQAHSRLERPRAAAPLNPS